MLRRVTGGGRAIAPFVGAYGKLPRIGDFVSVHAEKAPAFGFQEWLGRAVDWADRKQLAGWPATFEALPPAAFTYRPPHAKKAEGVLAGVMWASRDAVGQRYPFAVFSAVREDVAKAAPHLLPIAMQYFFDQATAMQSAFESCTSSAEVDTLLAGFRPLEVDESVASAYESWLSTTPVRETWESLYQRPDGDGDASPRERGPQYALQMIRESLAPFQSAEEAKTEICLRLPVGAHPAYETAFWLDLVHRIGKAPRSVPTTLYYPRGAPGRSLFIALGSDPYPGTLAEATVGAGDNDQVCDLTVAEPDRGSVSRLPVLAGELEGALRSDSGTLGHVIDALT